MTPDERQKHIEWVAKWMDVEFVMQKACKANVDLSDPAAMVRFFEPPLRVALMLTYPDVGSGLADMQVWLARLPRDPPVNADSIPK